jgi:hypothetical protein
MRPPFFSCRECGKVCKSARGLSQHSAVHRRPIQVGNSTQDFHREYHPLLNGIYLFYFCPSLYSYDISTKGYLATIMAISSHQICRQHNHHRRNRTTTGLHLHRGQDLSLPKSYTSRPTSLRALSINFSTSGVLRSFPTTISPPSPITNISMHRSTRSDWEISHGGHTLPNTSGSVPTMAQYRSG